MSIKNSRKSNMSERTKLNIVKIGLATLGITVMVGFPICIAEEVKNLDGFDPFAVVRYPIDVMKELFDEKDLEQQETTFQYGPALDIIDGKKVWHYYDEETQSWTKEYDENDNLTH